MKHASRELGVIRWFRRVSAQCDKIRSLMMHQRWLALARLLALPAWQHCLTEKRSKRSRREKVCDSIDLDRNHRDASMA
ncbi:MAG: hypothetical protein NTV34_01815 [Proteobacteria bacterium]|nr:hypothetical protein [Pseudomonadota bacterium]